MARGLKLGMIFRSGGSGAFDPVSLFGASEEGGIYDPSDLSTLWQDSARTTPVTANNDPVGAIDDLSGNGLHLLQTGTNRPIYKTDGSRHWIEFAGNGDDYMRSTGNGPAAKENFYSIIGFNVASATGIAGACWLFGVGPNVSGATGTMGIEHRTDLRRTNARLWTQNINTEVSSLDAIYSFGSPTWTEAYHESNTLTRNTSNGFLATQPHDDDVISTTRRPMSLADSTRQQGFEFFGGILINRALSSSEKSNVRAWIDARIGV